MSTVITLDGPTSSGKTSVGFLLSQKIGFQFIDSGAIYRAGTIAVQQKKVAFDNEDALAEAFAQMELAFQITDGKQRTILNGIDVTDTLHNPEVTQAVPIIAAFPKVREEAKKIQRRIGGMLNTIMAGRDIGTVIFPEAPLKFYLTADIQIRTQRRWKQIVFKIPEITFEEVLAQMIERDKSDMIRKVAPMRIPDDGIVIDTTELTTEQTVNKMLIYYQAMMDKQGKASV